MYLGFWINLKKKLGPSENCFYILKQLPSFVELLPSLSTQEKPANVLNFISNEIVTIRNKW